MTNDKAKFTLRIKDDLNDKLSKASAGMGISKNAFILMTLTEKLDRHLKERE